MTGQATAVALRKNEPLVALRTPEQDPYQGAGLVDLIDDPPIRRPPRT